MFVEMKMQQMLKVCGSFPPEHHLVTRVSLCSSVCVYKLSSKEAIKTLHSIGGGRQEFHYKHRPSGSCSATLPLTRGTNTHMSTHLHMKKEQDGNQDESPSLSEDVKEE